MASSKFTAQVVSISHRVREGENKTCFEGLWTFQAARNKKRHLTCSCFPTFKSFDPEVSGDPLSPFASLCELEITSFILLEVCSLALIPFRGHLAHGNFQRQLLSGSCA